MSKRYKAVNLTLDYDTIDYLKERCQGNMSATVRLLVIEAKQKEDSLESVLERLAKVEHEIQEDRS